MAQECQNNTEFHLNTASYVFELLNIDSDEPAGYGEPARVVVTDLFNRAMPLVRYDTGDIAVPLDSSACDWNTQVVKSIDGRVMDCLYDTSGKRLSPVVVTNYMWPFDRLRQFQFVQNDRRDYLLKLNGAVGNYSDQEFVRLFQQLLGEDARIAIEHVDEIPVLSSGKRKHVVCRYDPATK